jgi:hypothetical protein
MPHAIGLIAFGILFAARSATAQTAAPDPNGTNQTAAPSTIPADNDDAGQADAKKTSDDVYRTWVGATDPEKKKDEADDVILWAVKAGDKERVTDVFRGGSHREQLLSPPRDAERISPKMLLVLPGITPSDDASQYDHRSSPLFRRMTANRFEAWTSTDGWLFDARGHLLHHVRVPRRDGKGRAWFGAFLPSGQWITTDLWNDDRQLNCFSADGKWLWELRGKAMMSLAASDPEKEPPGYVEEET